MKPKTERKRKSNHGFPERQLRLVEALARKIGRGHRDESIMQRLADELYRSLRFRVVVVTQFDASRNGFRIVGFAPRTRLMQSATRTLGINIENYVFPYLPKESRVIQLLTEGKSWVGNDFTEITSSVFPRKAIQSLQKFFGIHSVFNAPLLSGKTLIGTVLIGSEAAAFSEDEKAFLTTFAHHAAVAVLQARLIAESRGRTEQYRLLSQVDTHILEKKDLQEVLKAIVGNINTVIPCDLAGIYLYDAKRKNLYHSVASNRSAYALKLPKFDISLGQGIIGHVAITRKAMLVNHAERDPRSIYPPGKKPKLEHLVCFPLIAGRRLLGVMHVGRFRDDPFRKADLEIVRSFSVKSALAIDNAKLLRQQMQREKELESLQKSGANIAETLDLRKVLSKVLAEAMRAIPAADGGSLMLVDEVGRELFVAASVGRDTAMKESLRLPWGKGLGGYVARTRRSMILDDVHKSLIWIETGEHQRLDIRSVVAIPLVLKDKAIGVLTLDSANLQAFTHHDVAWLDLFALNAAFAVSNARLHASVQQEVKKIRLLRDIKGLSRKGLSTDSFLKTICEMMVELYQYNVATVALYDEATHLMKVVASAGIEASVIPEGYEQSIDEGIVGVVARSKNLRVAQDVSKDRNFVRVPGLSTKSELCVPILDAKDRLHGVINTESNRLHAFTETDVEALSAVASEIAGAIEERRLLSALSDSEKKFRRLFEETKDAIMITSLEGRITEVNQAAVDLFGFSSKEELLQLREENALYVYPGDRSILAGEVKTHGFLKDIELRMRKNTGERILVEATITVMNDFAGRASAYQSILRDITSQKENERKLHESEGKYRSLVEDSLVGVYIIQDGRFPFVNRRFAEIFGYTTDQIVEAVQAEDLVVPEDRVLVLENIRKRITGEMKSLRYGFRGMKKNGEVIEVEVYGTRSTYRGRPAVIGTILDRTQQQQQQREIVEWRQRYDLIIASSGGMVYDYNVLTGSILWSGSIAQVLGYTLAELKGTIDEWEGLIHPEDREAALESLRIAEEKLEPYDVEYRFRRKDGTFLWMHDRGFFVANENKRAVRMLGMMEDVHHQKELERRVRSSELRHRLLYEHANDAVFVMEGEIFVDCNPRATEMFGCRREDIVGQTPYAFSPPHQIDGSDSRSASLVRVSAALAGVPQQFAWRHIKRDGSLFEADVRLNKFEMEGKVFLQAQVRDISAELDAQEELARSEQKYRQLILQAGEAILVTDGEGKIVEANEKACTMLRTSRTELMQGNASMFMEGTDGGAPSYRKFYAQLIAATNGTVVEWKVRRKDGTIFECEVSAVLLGTGLLQSIMRDVTEKKSAEKELDQIYALATTLHGEQLFNKAAVALADLLNFGHILVGELNEDGTKVRTLTYYRQGAFVEGMTYNLAETPCEQSVIHSIPFEVNEQVLMRFPRFAFLQEWKIESYFGLPMIDSNGRVLGLVCLLNDTSHRFTDHEKKIVSIIAQRLAAEVEMMAQQKREESLSQQLLQSQKMESLGTLAGGVAHDFNNILGAVIGYTSLIRRQTDPSSQTGRYLEAIEKSAQRAASLSRQLLSFSHKTHGDIKPVSVNDLINDTLHILGSSFPKTITITTGLSPENPKILGDQNLLGQVIMNLCINARDAILDRQNGTDGILHLETSHFEAGAGFVDLHLSAAPGDYVCINVNDNGVGMTEDLKRRIFEPFFTTKGKGKGTGLGLSMVYGIVRNHNGFIDVYSEPHRGTSFKIFLPAATESAEIEVPFEGEDLPRGNGELVLVVEDEPMLRELVADVLKTQGYDVALASNGKEAVQLFSSGLEKIRLVILDMIMPEMDGPATFQALRAINPELRIIICSGFSQDSSVQKLLSQGAAGFVGKPYQTEDLLKIIAEELK